MEATEVCPVCRERIRIYAIGSCDHAICFKCATRMRVLCEQNYCAICRNELVKVYFMRSDQRFDNIQPKNYHESQKHGIMFDGPSVKAAFYSLLEHSCPLCYDRPPDRSFDQLDRHMRRDHEFFYCDLCVDNLKIFPYERKYYDRRQLALHRRRGDPDDKSYKGHPLCEFCEERYLDNDELAKHLRKEHYYCHFCESDGSSSNQFYSDYSVLRDHFQEQHYLCEDGECKDSQFTHAFRSEIDFKAHVVQQHRGTGKRSADKQTRIIDVEFQLPPRSRDRQRGVITGADFQDNGESFLERNQRAPNDRQQGRRNRNRDKESDELAEALRASRKEAEEQQKLHEAKEKQLKHNEENFPSLSGSLENSASSLSGDVMGTLAQKLSLAQGLSVKGIDYTNVNTYPTLKEAMADSTNIRSAAGADSSQSGMSSAESSSEQLSLKAITTPYAQKVLQRRVSEEFPSLVKGNKSKEKKVTSSSTKEIKNAWAEKKPTSKPYEYGKKNGILTSLIQTTSRDSSGQSSPLNTKGGPKFAQSMSLAALSQALHDDDKDFPTLSTKVQQAGQERSGVWVRKVNHVSAKHSEPSNSSPGKMKKARKTITEIKPKVIDLGKIAQDLERDKESKPSTIKKAANSTDVEIKTKKLSKHVGKNTEVKPVITDLSQIDLDSLSEFIPSVIVNVANNRLDKNTSVTNTCETDSGMSGHGSSDATDTRTSAVNVPITKTSCYYSNMEPSREANSSVNSTYKQQNQDRINSYAPSISFKKQLTSLDDFPCLISTPVPPAVPPTAISSYNSGTEQRGPPSSASSSTYKQQNKIGNKEPKVNKIDKADSHTKSISLKEQLTSLADFPSLTPVSGPHAAPPGFGTTPANPPPGFKAVQGTAVVGSESNKGSRPPPGFALTFVMDTPKVNISSKAPVPKLSQIYSQQKAYVPPSNSQTRNKELIANIKSTLCNDDEKFQKFKLWSGEFRHSSITAENYYDKCRDLLGENNFCDLYPELLVLLPDITKQQDLYSVQQKKQNQLNEYSMKTGRRNWGKSSVSAFLSCPYCNQLLVKDDYSGHLSNHSVIDTEYPSLTVTAT